MVKRYSGIVCYSVVCSCIVGCRGILWQLLSCPHQSPFPHPHINYRSQDLLILTKTETHHYIVPEKQCPLCALWKANQNNPNKRGVEVCSCHFGQVEACGGVGTKILACGAPRISRVSLFRPKLHTRPDWQPSWRRATDFRCLLPQFPSCRHGLFVCRVNVFIFVKPLFV